MERFSRRQGFRLMLGATQAVLLGAAGCPLAGYAATVTGIPGLLAYWRFSGAGGIFDQTTSNRNGTYDGTVSLVAGLPTDSDQGTYLPGTVVGTVPHDDDLLLDAFTLSLWVRLDVLPAAKRALFSKDGSGLSDGDFAFTVDDEGELLAQFQSATTQINLSSVVNPGTTYHIVVTASSSGFELWIDGKHIGTNTTFTNAWTNNTRDIQFASAPWAASALEMDIDEVAIYNRVLTDADVIRLSQRTTPVVADLTITVPEDATTVLDVINGATYVGRTSDLTLEVWNGSAWASSATTTNGSVAVVGATLEFTADDLDDQDSDTFDYRITDANGSSEPGTIDLTITVNVAVGEDDGQGGTLVYSWEANGAWITDTGLSSGTFLALTSRDYKKVVGDGQFTQPSPNRWVGGATVGGELLREVGKKSNWSVNDKMCWNFAPDGTPALEAASTFGQHDALSFSLELFHPNDGNGPRHMRVTYDVWWCSAADDNEYKPEGIGTTSGNYPNFSKSHEPSGIGGPGISNDQAPVKYFGLTQGLTPRGAANCCSWRPEKYQQAADGIGMITQTGAGGKTLGLYTGAFNRPNTGGFISSGGAQIYDTSTNTDQPGMTGCWWRHEVEVRLADPAAVPATAIRKDNNTVRPQPVAGQVAGFEKAFVTFDVDGLKGAAGTRTQTHAYTEMIHNPKLDQSGLPDGGDDLHELLNLTGPWFLWYYGGDQNAQGEVWAWVRRVQVYVYD